MKTVSNRRAILGLGLALTAMAPSGCAPFFSLRRPLELEAPSVLVQVGNLDPEERAVVKDYFSRCKWKTTPIVFADADGEEHSWSYELELDRWKDQELLHQQLSELRAPSDGHRILHNFASSALLEYTSSAARSDAAAEITIRVEPPGAELHLDTEIPGQTSPLRSSTGTFEVTLPFSVIRDHESLYFHSLYQGQYRYYRYLLHEQRQEPLVDVDGPEAFEAFRSEHGE